MDNLPPFARVEWLDAWKDAVNDGHIETAAEENKPIVCITIGWVLHSGPDGIQLANEYSPNGTFRGRSFIPTGMVKDIQILNLTKPRKKSLKSPPE